MKRKLLSVLLTLCLAFSLLPTAALADGEETSQAEGGEQKTYVAQIGEEKYETLQAAVNAANNGDTVTLLGDVTTKATIPAEKTITIDLNGKTLKEQGQVFDVYGNLTIKNGTVELTAGEGNAAIWLNQTAKLTIESDAIVFVPTSNFAIAFYSDCTAAELTVKGTLKGGNGLTVNGTIANPGNKAIVDGATIESEGHGIYQAGVSDIVVKNANITGSTAIEVRAGSMTIESGTFTATANEYKCDPNGNGATTEGAALAIAQHTTKKDISVTINGGTFNGIKALNESNPQNNYPAPQVDLKVTDGTFNGDVSITDDKNTSISGGTFTSDVSAYVPNGYIQNENGAVETLGETNAVAKVGDTYYKTLAAAINAASDGATITLLKDVTGSGIGATVTKKLTLDLNGHSIKRIKETSDSNAGYPALYVNGGDLTLIDTSAAKTGAVKSVITATTGASPYNAVSSAVYVNGGTFTLKSGALSTDVKNDKDQSQGVVVCQNSKFIMEDGSIIAESDSGNAFGVVAFTGSEFTLNNGTITSAGMGISGNGSSGEGNTTININGGSVTGQTTGIYQPQEGALNITAGEIKGGTGIEAKSGNVKIEITGTPTITATGEVKHTPSGNGNSTSGYAIAAVENNAYSGNANVSIANGFYNGEVKILKDNDVDAGKTATITITGGYFTSDPTAYLAAGKYVIKSDKAGYTYAVTGTEPEKTPIFVDENTTHDTSAITDGTTRSAIDAVINKAKVEGVAAAVDESALVASKVDASEVDAAKKVEVEVSVKVEVKSADLSGENAAKTLTFEAKPVATIKVDGNVRATNVAVPNSLLSGDITVKLPLPEGFTPEQIKHISSDRSVEYFLRTAKTGAKTFEIKDGCAVFTITKFSTFELSGTVTYVEPSYSSGSSYDPTYSVTVDKTKNGTVTVSPKSASKGDTVTVTVKPDSGYVLETLTVTDKNGNELTLKDKGNGKYTFTMPAGKVEVKATFMEDNSMLNFFYDVPNNAYFYEAVKWAVENGITTGVGNDLFAPEQPCTRAQIVTFLWRAAGSPEPKGAASGMTDVVSGSYYEKAVAWAIENGITTGTTTTTFSPDVTCTRAQAVTFLARALKAKAASAAEFSDVPTGSYFADAVAWAAANGVTEGIGGGLFGSDNDCTRGQIVTFLYRAYNK